MKNCAHAAEECRRSAARVRPRDRRPRHRLRLAALPRAARGAVPRRASATCCRCWPRCAARRSRGGWRSAGSPTRPPRRSTRRWWSARPARCRWRGSRSLPAGRPPAAPAIAPAARAVHAGVARRADPGDLPAGGAADPRAHRGGGHLPGQLHLPAARSLGRATRSQRFAALARAQRSRYAAFIDAGRFAVLSASPELCFRLEDDLLTCRPMKGTAPRGLTLVEDRLQAAGLRASEKERAENVMIVDMVRNDLGRIARVGTVRVPRLWETERYPTLWQMTSTVCAETAAPLDEILLALFPSASITGAPKVRTMQIIKEIERTPRGIYTGCVGRARPGPARLDERGDPDARRGPPAKPRRVRHRQRDRLGRAGRGRVRRVPDQDAGARRAAAAVSAASRRWPGRPGEGLLLLERHLRRIGDSAEYFGFACDAGGDARRASPRRRAGCAARSACGCCWTSSGGIEVAVAPLGLRAVTLSDAPPRAAGPARFVSPSRGSRSAAATCSSTTRPRGARSTSGRWPALPGATTSFS